MLQIACIGIGNWGKALVRTFEELEDISLGYCCDISLQHIQSIQVRNLGCRRVTEYKEVLSDKNIGAVAIATHTQAHYQLTKDTLLANKHVFVEKPIATVLPGKVIHEDALVGAGAVVTRDVPSRTIVIGVPAKKFKNVPPEQWLENQNDKRK